jgi:hypothetical protein
MATQGWGSWRTDAMRWGPMASEPGAEGAISPACGPEHLKVTREGGCVSGEVMVAERLEGEAFRYTQTLVRGGMRRRRPREAPSTRRQQGLDRARCGVTRAAGDGRHSGRDGMSLHETEQRDAR